MLQIRDVTRRFGRNTAVDQVALEIPEGQMVGIIGRSGAGKSTLLRMINRLIDPTKGSIFFEQTEVSALAGSALRRWQRDCAMIFQQFNLVPRLDVLTNVLLGRLNHRSTALNLLGMFSREERASAIASLERLGIAKAALQAAGKVVFDGAPEELTRETVRMVYGAEADGEEISEAITSTSIGGAKLRTYEPAKQLQTAFAAD